MRRIDPGLSQALLGHCGGKDVVHAPPFPVSNYRALVEQVAFLAYANREHMLFFRGQDRDYTNEDGGSTLLPPIYRGNWREKREVGYRLKLLEQAARMLVEVFRSGRLDGSDDVCRRLHVQWSILQHYGIVPTPLLDVTQSLRVACSFAQLAATGAECHVFVLGLPYVTHRISYDSEEDIINVRLLSICPPEALRPFFQEGYLVGTLDAATTPGLAADLDFRNRLVAKFSIPAGESFWGEGFEPIPRSALFPDKDLICLRCEEVRKRLTTGDVGRFLELSRDIEDRIIGFSREVTARDCSLLSAISELTEHGFLTEKAANELERLRLVRELVLDDPAAVSPSRIATALKEIREFPIRQFSSRDWYVIECSDCGNEARVPFRPAAGRPAYCADCYGKHKPQRF